MVSMRGGHCQDCNSIRCCCQNPC